MTVDPFDLPSPEELQDRKLVQAVARELDRLQQFDAYGITVDEALANRESLDNWLVKLAVKLAKLWGTHEC